MEMFSAYSSVFVALTIMGALMLLQVLVADVVSIRRRHVPGYNIEPNHNDLLFRVARVVGNTNETIAILILGVLLCILSGASPAVTAACAWVYVVCRVIYAFCYYAGIQAFRSIAFGASLLALTGLLVASVVT